MIEEIVIDLLKGIDLSPSDDQTSSRDDQTLSDPLKRYKMIGRYNCLGMRSKQGHCCHIYCDVHA